MEIFVDAHGKRQLAWTICEVSFLCDAWPVRPHQIQSRGRLDGSDQDTPGDVFLLSEHVQKPVRAVTKIYVRPSWRSEKVVCSALWFYKTTGRVNNSPCMKSGVIMGIRLGLDDVTANNAGRRFEDK